MSSVPKGEEYITPKKKSLLKSVGSGLAKGASWLGKEAQIVEARTAEELKKKKYRKYFKKGYGRVVGESAGFVEKPLSHYDSSELLQMLHKADKLPTSTAQEKADAKKFKAKLRKILRQRGEFARHTTKDEAMVSKLRNIA
jgi:hypothetical protein